MTKKQFLEYCSSTYGTLPDYPFENDFETAVVRHTDNRKWYALAMNVSRSKFCEDSDERVDVVNLKVSLEQFGALDAFGGIYPAYHMNKRYWISVILDDVPDDLVRRLTDISYEATHSRKKARRVNEYEI